MFLSLFAGNYHHEQCIILKDLYIYICRHIIEVVVK